jgi:hypothetical protein
MEQDRNKALPCGRIIAGRAEEPWANLNFTSREWDPDERAPALDLSLLRRVVHHQATPEETERVHGFAARFRPWVLALSAVILKEGDRSPHP